MPLLASLTSRARPARAFIALMSQPIATAIAGPLVDGILLLGMMQEGSLEPLFGWLIGVDPGDGISLLFLLMGLIRALFGFGAYTVRQVRDVESILPDHDAIDCGSEVYVLE
jgi:Na+-transporting NADH:ubiquinone oxidoreductase subunit NqrD